MKKWSLVILQILLVVIILLAGIISTKKLIATKPKIGKEKPQERASYVRVKDVMPEVITIVIQTEGTVRASKEIEIVPEVSGKAVYVSENLVRGGRFKKDELLIKIDNSDYIAQVKKAEAELKTHQARLHQLKEESEEARMEWKVINPDTPPPALLLKLPEIEATEAAIEAANASLEKAKLELKRTEISAPFSGVVITENVDVGQYLTKGKPVARVFSDEKVEIKVNLTEGDVGFIDVPGFNTLKPKGSNVVVETLINKKVYKWHGYVERAEIVDEGTRTIPTIITVKDPYLSLPPLSVGAFVEVRIKGHRIKEAVFIERSALQWTEKGEPFVWIVDPKGRLSKKEVTLIRAMDGGYVVKGLNGGSVIITPPLEATEGMKVRSSLR